MRTRISSPEPGHPDPETQRAWEAWNAMMTLGSLGSKPSAAEALFDLFWTKNPRPRARTRTHKYLSSILASLDKRGAESSPELVILRNWVNKTGDQILAEMFIDPEDGER